LAAFFPLAAAFFFPPALFTPFLAPAFFAFLELSTVLCSLFIFSVAKRNYYPLATVAIKKKCLLLTQPL
jgi:hypothetical protein